MQYNNSTGAQARFRYRTTLPNTRRKDADRKKEGIFFSTNSPLSPASNQNKNTKSILQDSNGDGVKSINVPACGMSGPAISHKAKPLKNVFDGSISTADIMTNLEGHGGTSRMFARGKLKEENLSSVGRFFSRGSTLERATAFTKSAVAYERNANGLSGIYTRPNQMSRPSTIADELDACHEHPVQEMQFFNVGGAKVFFYYGLDTIRSPEHVMAAGEFGFFYEPYHIRSILTQRVSIHVRATR